MEYEPIPIISNNFTKVVIPLIENALFSIDVIVFDWRFYKNEPDNPVTKFNEAFAGAVKRGVEVRCLIQNASVVNNLKQMGCKARFINSKRILHTKLLIIDKNLVVLGSHNYTKNAFTSNHEASIFVHLKDKENGMVEYFNNLYGL